MNGICFNCEKKLVFNRMLEELLKAKFPVFCSPKCADSFPDHATDEFEARFIQLKRKYGGKE